ncbi:glycosyltransferase [Kordiimonas aquimaris]|uniref:glycosyltransferase n=1 Tax=Kordiimonas aquimaris TaxID=707591 RepID=UPI0021D178D7|nr:glycosyltransferase family 2 protein [Kordiimonas aquimaris]
MPSMPKCTVIIPAFNEEAAIGGTLGALQTGMFPGEFDIIVVCNGCTDQTVRKAHSVAPSAKVVDIQLPSKTMALNVGIAAAKHKPIVFLDADIKTSPEAVRSLVNTLLDGGIYLAYGNAFLQTRESSVNVRAFYRAWSQNGYFDNRKVGGFFAISSAGLKCLGTFPDVINDDEFVRRQLSERSLWVEHAQYVVRAPLTLKSLMKVRSRVYRGNAQLERSAFALGAWQKFKNACIFLGRLFVRPMLWHGAIVFLSVSVAAHIRNRLFVGKKPTWEQDQSARNICAEV